MIISRRGFLKGVAGGVVAATVPKIALAAGELYVPPPPDLIEPDSVAISREPGRYITQCAQEGVLYPRPDYSFECDGHFHFDVKRKVVTYVGETGFRVRDMYASMKDQWKNVPGLVAHDPPMMAITPELVDLEAGWQVNPSSFDWMREGMVRDLQNKTKWMTVIGLSAVDEAPAAYLYRTSVSSQWETNVIGEEMLVNPWYHTIQLTPEVEGLRWCGITPTSLFWEFNTELCGVPLGSLYENNGSLRYPFTYAEDLNYSYSAAPVVDIIDKHTSKIKEFFK